MRWFIGSAIVWSAISGGCLFKASSSEGGGQISKRQAEQPRDPAAAGIDVPAGYRIELVARGLTFPTGIAFGADGAIYVTESGYSYGEVITPAARVVELDPRSRTVKREIARGKHAPWNGLTFHDGALYVAQGGALGGGRIVRLGLDGTQTILVDGLPSLGDHHTNGPIIVDGWLYFGQGTVTNSGIVGVDSYDFGWLRRHPDFHDMPCRDIKLAGKNFKSKNPLRPGEALEVETGPYLPFGTPSLPGQVIRGQTRCNGAILRVRLDGSGLEVVAWGLRNPFGLASAPDGTIYLTENGADIRGSRPVFGAADVLWKLEPGAWYGWPDHVKGQPITMSQYDEADGDPQGFVLAEHPARPPTPVGLLGVHASANGFDIARGRFGYPGHAFIALFGDMAPEVGKVLGPVGFKVVRLDLRTGISADFARNRGPRAGPASRLGTRGLERPVAARFDPQGDALYIVDFGVMRVTKAGPEPQVNTGAVWRITREGADARAR